VSGYPVVRSLFLNTMSAAFATRTGKYVAVFTATLVHCGNIFSRYGWLPFLNVIC